MKRVEFKLTMPGVGSWNGRWTGEGKDYLIWRSITDKKATELGLDATGKNSWYHSWDDGWAASIQGRVMAPGEKKKKSAGFYGYQWMVDNIMCYNATERPAVETTTAPEIDPDAVEVTAGRS